MYMEKKLQENDIFKLKNNFLQVNGLSRLASLLEVKTGYLYYWIKKQAPSDKYKLFKIKKKNGGERIILAPKKSYKILQKKLNKIFSLFYDTKPAVHGFVKNKTIITNAECHKNKRLILNIDLEDFFPTINRGRIYGIFRNKPFNFSVFTAKLLANMCCVNNQIPQGAPTSPMLSNFVCRRLDNSLTKLAREFKCSYTRYADDITFSTNLKEFPKEIMEIVSEDDKLTYKIGEKLKRILSQNGFVANKDKIRIASKYNRQSVTGLTVNEKVNVPRTYIKTVRAMLCNWEINKKKGSAIGLSEEEILANATKYHNLKNTHKTHKYKDKATFLNILRGKLNYIKDVRGDRDYVYAKLINKFNELAENGKKLLPTNQIEEINQNVLVLEGICNKTTEIAQGTVFLLESVGFVTCYHCIFDSNNEFRTYLRAFHTNALRDSEKYEIEVLAANEHVDLAIIKILNYNIDINTHGFKKGNSDKITYGDRLKMAGFPDYDFGQSPDIKSLIVTRRKMKSLVNHICVDKPIIKGHSGGPVFNARNEIIGVASQGSAAQYANDSSNFSVTPINEIEKLLNN